MNNPEDEPKPKRRAKTDDKSCTSSGTNDDSAGTSDDMVGDINDIILFMYFFLFIFGSTDWYYVYKVQECG